VRPHAELCGQYLNVRAVCKLISVFSDALQLGKQGSVQVRLEECFNAPDPSVVLHMTDKALARLEKEARGG
jgi:hypothetical protein